MMEFKQSVLEAIGNTPLVRINQLAQGIAGNLYAKLEYLNPGGSIKDRIGYYMIEQAEKAGEIRPGGTIVEATSGNTGMGLAIAAAVKGYQTIFVMPDKMTEEKRANLRAFGAKVVITPTAVPPESPESYYSVAARLSKEIPNCYYANQYHNLKNRETHYHTTGPEILRQTEGKVDAIVMGMGTCGTISGIGRFFKEKNPKTKIIGVDPKGSMLKDLFDTGKLIEAQQYLIEGIGEDIIPKNLDLSTIDEIVRVEDRESFLMTRKLVKQEGIFAGISSGAAVVGAIRYMQNQKKPGTVIVILPDGGGRYLSKVYNDSWMIENSFFEETAEARVGQMIHALKKKPGIISVPPHDTIEHVAQRMNEAGVSQLPVMHEGVVLGLVTESGLLKPLFSGAVKASDPIDKVLDQDFSIVKMDDPLHRLQEIFSNQKIALVSENNEVRYVVSKIDLITYLSQKTRSQT